MENIAIKDIKVEVPSDLHQAITVARYDVLKHLRSKRLLGVLVLEAIVLVLMLVFPPLLGNDYAKDPAAFLTNYVGWVNILVVIGVTMFSGDAIVSEFQNRTGYLLFPNPVKRWVLYLGKFLASISIAVFLLLIYYAIAILFAAVITGGFTDLVIGSMLFAMFYAIAAVSLGFMISSLMKGATGSLVLTFFLLFMILPLVDGLLTFGGVKPFFILTFCAGFISAVMITPYPVDFSSVYPIGQGQVMTIWTYYPELWTSIGVIAVYTIVCFIIGLILFQRREMVG